jgi:hypothetical protein
MSTKALPMALASWTDEDLVRLPPQLRDRDLLAWLWAQASVFRGERHYGSYSIQFNHDMDGICRNVNLSPPASRITVRLGPLAEKP